MMASAPDPFTALPQRSSAPVSSPPSRPSRLRPGGQPGAARVLPATGSHPEPDPCRTVLLFFTTGAVAAWHSGPLYPAD
jgi:hypothetical protein